MPMTNPGDMQSGQRVHVSAPREEFEACFVNYRVAGFFMAENNNGDVMEILAIRLDDGRWKEIWRGVTGALLCGRDLIIEETGGQAA